MLPLERMVMTDETEMYGAVSNALWLQRELLETLLYRLVAEQLILTSGTTRWLAKADGDVRHALDQLRRGEVARAMHVEALASMTGVGGEPALADLATLAPGMWAEILTDHRAALQELSFEVQRVADENGRLLQAGAQAVRDTLAGIGNAVHRYDATGSAVRGTPGAMLLDEQA
jgi:hypothetical protein